MKQLKLLAVIGFIFAIHSLSAQENEKYYFSKTIKGTFEETVKKVKEEMKKQGFGVITEIDMDKKLHEKLDNVDIKPYKILGVCNPSFAYKTLQIEENIGLFLPCKAVIKELDNGMVEVVIVSPTILMKMLGKKELVEIAKKVTEKFQLVLDNI
jgi:uncharacterized protein (DUF302 family)